VALHTRIFHVAVSGTTRSSALQSTPDWSFANQGSENLVAQRLARMGEDVGKMARRKGVLHEDPV
jgi:hypothetical protein